MRKEFSAKTKLEAFERCRGRCEGADCDVLLRPGRWHCDHVIPCELDGDNSLGNAQCLCEPCHRTKTGQKDIPAIAKSKRIRRRLKGIRKSRNPLPGGRASKWKRKVSGEVVPR